MKNDTKTMIIDVDSLSEFEYGGYRIRRVEPQYHFYVITALDENTSAKSLGGKWTSPREAMAAIDAVSKRR